MSDSQCKYFISICSSVPDILQGKSFAPIGIARQSICQKEFMDEYGMLCLNEQTFNLVFGYLKAEPAYQDQSNTDSEKPPKKSARNIFFGKYPIISGDGKKRPIDFKEKIHNNEKILPEDAKTLIMQMAADNSTRTPAIISEIIGKIIFEGDNDRYRYIPRILKGDFSVVTEILNRTFEEQKKRPELKQIRIEKSLCSKACKYIQQWYFQVPEKDELLNEKLDENLRNQRPTSCFCINDSVIRNVLPYYLAYYHVENISDGKDEAWEQTTASGRKVISFEAADYSLLARYFTQLLEKVNKNSTKRFSVSELDSLLWYGYRNDSVRQEMARALAKII